MRNSNASNVFLFLWIGFVIFLSVVSLRMVWSDKKDKTDGEELLSDPFVTEIGWRETSGIGWEPLSGTLFFTVYLNDETNDIRSTCNCYVGPIIKIDDYTRIDPKSGRREVYVFSKAVAPNQNIEFFCLKDAIFLRKDK